MEIRFDSRSNGFVYCGLWIVDVYELTLEQFNNSDKRVADDDSEGIILNRLRS
jgi:hypothetical protein